MSIDLTSKLVSKLGSPDSKIPLGVKDSFNSAGYTYFSYDAGGSVEGKDRFVDEVGTGLIWLFGIPLFRKFIDKTLFKLGHVSPEVDVRVVKDKNYIDEAIKHAPTNEISNELKESLKNVTKVKCFAVAKFLAAMGLTMLSYLGLTKLKQKMTRLNIEKEFNEKMKSEQNKDYYISPKQDIPAVFNDITGKQKNKYSPSFGSASVLKLGEEFMLNPVKNMIILDVGITGERLSNARTDGELKEYAIKEGSFIFCVYCADNLIRQTIENASMKFLNTPIALDAKLLSSDLSKNILINKEMQNQIESFASEFINCKDNKKLYDFMFTNQNHVVVDAAKQSGIISTVKDNGGVEKIDTRKYIEPDKIKKLVKDLQTYINISKQEENIDKYLSKIKKLKIASTVLSISSCCLFLGYLVPKFMYEYRHKQQDGNKNFHVRTEYEKELALKAKNEQLAEKLYQERHCA